MTSKSVISLDPATLMGWAATKPRMDYGTEDFHNSKWDGAGMRFLKFENWLTDLIISAQPVLLTYEKVEAHTATYAAQIYGGWISVIQKVCEEHKIPYQGVPVQTIKKHWTGSHKAGKDAMITEARKRGFNPKDDNAADALAILDYTLTNLLR